MQNHGESVLDEYKSKAENCGVHYLDLLIREKSKLLSFEESWPNVINFGSDAGLAMMNLNMVESRYEDLLTEYSKNIGEVVQFPPSTVFMHGLGVIASAMTKSFSVEYRNGKTTPVNLYVVTAQPPSTGKSGVNDFFMMPVQEAFKSLNESTEIKREMFEEDLAILLKDYAKNSSSMDGEQRVRAKTLMKDTEKEALEIPKYRYSLDDATIEAAEGVASKQGGMFNIISAEAESINVIIGAVYGDSKTKSNAGLILKGWDNEYFSSARMSRDGYEGNVRGSIAVLAQYDSVDTILEAGAGGRGIAERFLLFAENNILGERAHKKKTQLNIGLRDKYESLIKNVVHSGKVTFTVEYAGKVLINNFRDKIEPKMKDGGEYSGNMITGFAGKADKQILKIAGVLHACDHWHDHGDKRLEISQSTINRAMGIFSRLIDAYVNVSDVMGHAGTCSEINKAIEKLIEVKKKNNTISVTGFVNIVRSIKPFRDARKEGFTDYFKNNVLSVLQKNNYCHVYGNKIYINPNL